MVWPKRSQPMAVPEGLQDTFCTAQPGTAHQPLATSAARWQAVCVRRPPRYCNTGWGTQVWPTSSRGTHSRHSTGNVHLSSTGGSHGASMSMHCTAIGIDLIVTRQWHSAQYSKHSIGEAPIALTSEPATMLAWTCIAPLRQQP